MFLLIISKAAEMDQILYSNMQQSFPEFAWRLDIHEGI